MELPKIGKSDRGMLDGIKSKLGFASSQDAEGDEYDEPYYDDQDEEYDDFGEPGDEYGDAPDYGEYGYDAAPDTARPSGFRESYGSSSHSSSPRLVSIDDVRVRTQIPDSLNRDPLPERHVTIPSTPSHRSSSGDSRFRSSRKREHAADYMLSTDTSDIPDQSASTSDMRSSGYNSLFSSTDGMTPSQASTTGSRGYDPYETFSGTGVTSHNPSRSLTVLKPVNYGEVERVAKVVKAGDVVVLSLRNTPDHLAKRILDFSFGVSSALDASVECIADKVFVIIRGRALDAEEKMNLRNQGVL